MSYRAFDVMKDKTEMKISVYDLQNIVTEHFSNEGRVCIGVTPMPKKNPTHYVLNLVPREKKAAK